MANITALGQKNNVLSSNQGLSILGKNNAMAMASQNNTNAQTVENSGSFGEGLGYLGHKVGLGFLSGVEGIWDYTAGGIAKLFGGDEWAEKQFANDWANYSAADEWFNPSSAWQTAGDVAGGIGTTLPAMLGAAAGAAIIYFSGGSASSVGGQLIINSIAAGIAGFGAAGNATKEAYRETGQLTGKEFGYGALSGATEAGIEFATAGIGKGTGRIIKKIGEKAVREGAESVAKTVAKTSAKSIFRELGEDFISEGLEEGIAEFLSPYYQRMTYNPDAENATAQEILYAAMVGGLSGMVMTGASTGVSTSVNTVSNLSSGKKSVESGSYNGIIKAGKKLSEIETDNNTGIEAFESAKDTYNKLTNSLMNHNNISTIDELFAGLDRGTIEFKVNDLINLGKLKRSKTVASIQPYIEKSARAILFDADRFVQKVNSFNATDANGKRISVTSEDILSGIDKSLLEKAKAGTLTKSERSEFTKSYRKALTSNSVLSTLAIADATGQIMMDTRKIAESVALGENIASNADINYLIEKGKPEEIAGLGKAFGIEDWSKVTSEQLSDIIQQNNESGAMSEYAEQVKRRKSAIEAGKENAKPLPHLLKKNMQDGVYRYASEDGSLDMAILKEGDEYRIYDYANDNLSRALTTKDVNSILNKFWTDGKTTTAKSIQITEETTLARQTADIDLYAMENVPGYKSMSEPNKAAVRMTIRQARAHKLSDADTAIFAKVAAKSGLNVIFDAKRALGDGSISGNTIYVNPSNTRVRMYQVILAHEMFHKLFSDGSKRAGKLFLEAKSLVDKNKAEEVRKTYKDFYAKLDASATQANVIAEEEVGAAGVETVFNSEKAWEYILSEEPTLSQKVLSFFRKSARDYSSIQDLSAQARKMLRHYKSLFEKLSERNQGNNALSLESQYAGNKKEPITSTNKENMQVTGDEEKNPIKAKMSGDVSDARFSLAFSEDIANNQREYVNRGYAKISQEEVNKAIDDTAHMVKLMQPYSDILPQDKVGKTLVKNGSYDVSVENTTICIRTLAYNSFVDMVSEKVGRPLTQMESFLVSQKLYEIAKEPQCLYCYVSLDRKAFNEMVIRYVDQRDAAIKAYEEAGKPKIPSSMNAEWKLFKDFLDGRKATTNMWDRYVGWLKAYNTGEKLVTLEDISTEAKRLELVESKGTASAQVKDILKYAQSASWAKKQMQYVAYYDEILKLKPQVIRNLNSHYGMRWYSFSDYSGAFIVENMQQITDAAIRGLKGLSYTKDTDFAEIFAPTGMNINISVYAKKTDSGYEIDAKQSADINTAIKLRNKYKNVGIVVVATDKQGVEWALEQEWSDVVIPFHTVRTGADVAEFYNWEIFNAEQSDVVSDQNLWDAYVKEVGAKKASKNVYPSEHQNNRKKYLEICESRGLTPRFKSFLDNPNYMKLVNETRQSESETTPLKAEFDVKAAERSFNKFVEKGGYYEGWYNDGIDVDNEADIVASDVKAGKKANEVSYGRQDVTFEDIAKSRKTNREHGTRYALPTTDSLGNTLTEAQQEFFQDSKVRNKKGNLLVVYHGTTADFNTFKKGDIGFHFGTKGAARGRVGYGKNVKIKEVYLNITNPIIFAEDLGSWDADYRLTQELYERELLSKAEAEQVLLSDDKSYRRPTEKANKKLAEMLIAKGYDGIEYSNTHETKTPTTSYIAFSSNQAKDITNTNPTLNPDIRFALDGKNVDKNVDFLSGDDYNLSSNISSKGAIIDEQNSKDSGVLESRVLSAVSESKNNERHRSDDTEKVSKSMAKHGDAAQKSVGNVVYRANSSGYLGRKDINSSYIFKRLMASISRNWEGKLADRDSNGRIVPQEIKEKFKNTALKNENGELLSLYHWTNANFTEFKIGDIGFHFGTYEAALDRRSSKNKAINADWVKDVYLNIKNPIFLDDYGFWDASAIAPQLWEQGLINYDELVRLQRTKGYINGEYTDEANKAVRKILKDLRYDGIIYQNAVEDDGTLSVAALYPDQIYTVAEETVSKNTRYALTGNEDIDGLLTAMDLGYNEYGVKFNAESVLERGIPRKPGASTLTIGEMKKTVANNTHYQVFSKGKALEVIGKMSGTSELTAKTRAKLADALWQGFNDCTDVESRQTFAHDMAEYIVATMATEAKVENPDIRDAQERLSYLGSYVGKITFHPEYLAEIRHLADKKGMQKILGRWGYKGKSGTNRVPMDIFVVDIARDMPGMSELEKMHPVEAFMELDAMYEKAKAEVKDKWISSYYDATDAEMLSLVWAVEDDIMRAFETEGDKSKFAKLVENKIEYYSVRAEFWKAEHDKIKGRDRILGLLMAQAQKMKDLRLGTYANATQMESETFKNSIEKLAKIQFRGNLNVSGTRKVMGELLQWYQKDNALLEYADEANPGLYVQGVADMLEALSTGDKGFTKDELLMMYDVMSYFTKFVENYGKVFRNGKMIEALPEAKRYIEIVHANENLKVGLFAKLSGSWYAELFNDPASVVRRMDYYERGFYTEMYEDLRDAAVNAETSEMRIMRDYDEFLRNNKKYMEKASEELIEYRGHKITKIKLIDLYMTMKRKHAWTGIALSGYSFKNLEGKTVRVPGFITDEHITETELEAAIKSQQKEIEKFFTDADRQYMALLEKGYNEDARKLKADRDMQRLGFTNATTDYYYPIKRANIAKNIDTSEAQAEYDRVTNSSFNKDIVRGARQEIAIESADSRFRRHIHAVCQYSYLSPAIEAFNRLYNLDITGNKNRPVSVRTESDNIWAKGNKYFMDLISDIQGIPRGSSEESTWLSSIRGSYAKFQLGANPKVWLTQMSSIFASSSILDATSITQGMFVSSADIDEYCHLAGLRNYENTAAMAQGVLDRNGKARSGVSRAAGKVGKLSDALMSPIGKMDRFVVCRLFGACQVQVEKNGGAKVGTEANKIEAGKLLQKVILETQQNSLATERSKAMRSNSEFWRAVTMFTADSMKVMGRVVDAFGEISVLHAKIKATTDANVKAELQARLKTARRNARKALTALVLSALFMASIAQLFRHIYDKELKEDETVAEVMVVDAVGNLFGGLPLIKDLYARVFEGYGFDNYAYSSINDILDSAINLFNTSGDIIDGSSSSEDVAKGIKNLAYSVGQLTGLPTRNVYNVFYGLTKRFSPESAYKIDSAFYKKNYQSDLYKAIENNDVEMTGYILSLLYNERMGTDITEPIHKELYHLSAKGYKVIPKTAPKSITIDDVEYELAEAETNAIRAKYSDADESIEKLLTKSKYQILSDDLKAEAINYVYNVHYNKALESVLGIDRGGNTMLVSSAVGAENLALLHVYTKGITSDTDALGNTVSGSKRAKVVAAINKLDVSREQKLLLICSKGYALKDGDLRGVNAETSKKILLGYILKIPSLNKDQKAELAKMCGFEVKNGKIIYNT